MGRDYIIIESLVGMLGCQKAQTRGVMKFSEIGFSYFLFVSGFLDYQDWECISLKCIDLKANFSDDPENFYCRNTICDNNLKPKEDFNWTVNRTSYSLEWGLICSDEYKGSNLQSFFFIGAFIGLMVGSVLFDTIGRKTTCLIGIVITSLTSVTATFVNSYSVMLPMRVVQGIGTFIAVSGVDLLSLEYTPSNLRNLSQILSSGTWDVGTLLIVGISYGVKNWHHIYLVQGCVLAGTAVAVLIYPESPRFQLVKGREQEARATFRKLSKIFKTQELSAEVELTYKNYDKNYFGQIADFKRYPLLLKNTVILMACWMMISCVDYGLRFSWSKLGTNIYTSILFSSFGDLLAKGSGMSYYIIHFLGRKKALMINFAGSATIFFLSIPSYRVHITDSWTLGKVLCLLVSLFNAGVWISLILLTKEISPTSHRGMIFSTCSASARIGAFIGPYLALLYNTLDSRIVLSIFGGIAAGACFLAYFSSDSTARPIPSTPEDLVYLHSKGGYNVLRDEDIADHLINDSQSSMNQ